MTDHDQIESRFTAWDAIMTAGTFEDAYAALEESVHLLESGGLSLDQMTRCYEAGIRLSRRCNDLLKHAELQITMLEDSIAGDEDDEDDDEEAPDAGDFVDAPFD
jgi:exodeoxyribonuclease VII small subunit